VVVELDAVGTPALAQVRRGRLEPRRRVERVVPFHIDTTPQNSHLKRQPSAAW
jgi:hypothetical protein